MKEKWHIATITEVALFSAIGYILDSIASFYSAPLFPNGGSIGISMVCVFIICYRHGFFAGLLTGFIMALFDIMDGFYTIAASWYVVFAQVLLDYILAYPLVAFAGLFKKKVVNNNRIHLGYLVISCFLGGFLKFAVHFLSGVIFWKDPKTFAWGFSNPYLYSFIYNMAYMLPCIVISVAFLILISFKWPFILTKTRSQSPQTPAASDNENRNQ